MNVLGIDYGEKHVGVALAEGPLASPLITLNTQTAISEINKLVSKHKIEKIIIGDCPLEFVNLLKTVNCELEIVDETLSSHDARQSLLHTTQNKRREKEHAAAAAIILQSWIDSCKV
jgi:RNase H-fold protein (predicted Holliday junction resolvase)